MCDDIYKTFISTLENVSAQLAETGNDAQKAGVDLARDLAAVFHALNEMFGDDKE